MQNRALLFLFSLPVIVGAQTTVLDPVVPATPTQAVIHVTATNSDGSPFTGPCSYRISEGASFTALVNDVNPVLFTGADSDGRPGSIIRGRDHYFVAGTRLAAKASDNKFYSRALQAATQHWVGVTCGTVPEVSTTFTTENMPLGSIYPEFPAFDSGAFGNVAVPTIDFTDKTKTYIDPLSGILLKRISGPLDYVTQNPHGVFGYARDMNGAWTNPQNAMTDHVSGSLASIATPNAPLFLAWKVLNDTRSAFDGSETTVDLKLRAYCSGTNGAKLQACISLDSGQSCASDPIEIACPTSLNEVAVPGNYPSPMFAGWGTQAQALSTAMISNSTTPNVHVSGSTVTWVSESRNLQFYNERAPGSKIQIAGTAPGCPNNVCTIASMDSPTQITIQESVGSPVDGVMQDYGAGIRVWLENTGGSPSASASFSFDYVNASNFFGAVNAEYDTCSSLPITDIATDRVGNPLPNGQTLTGYLCNIGSGTGELVLWIPSTGESRLMSSYYQTSVSRMYLPTSPFSTSDPKTFFAQDRNHDLWKGTLNSPPGRYIEYVPGAVYPPNLPDNVTWTDLTAASAPLEQQVASRGGSAATMYATGLYPKFSFWALLGGYATYISSNHQDAPCLFARTLGDTNQLVQAFTSWDIYPLRWGGCHTSPLGVGSLMNVITNAPAGHDKTVPLYGPFTLKIKQLRRNGAWTTYTQPIAGASNTNPVKFTAPAHGIDPRYNLFYGTGADRGPTLTIAGGTGNWAAANGTWNVNVDGADLDHFTIPALDSSSFGPMSGSLTFTAAPPLLYPRIASITTATPAVITTAEDFSYVPNKHRFQDGDPIGFSNFDRNGQQTGQYYVKASGYTDTTFAVYADQQLTQPVDGNTLQAVNGGHVYFAEVCPSGIPTQFTSGAVFDTGASGVRCFTVKVAGEPCSSWAAPGEQAQFPCKSDPSNTAKSSLQDMQLGDSIRDIGDNQYSETLVLVKKVKNSETDMDLTFMRWWGNTIGGDTHVDIPEHQNHNVGWTPFMVPSLSIGAFTGWMDANDSTNTIIPANPRFTEEHGDFGNGNAPGLVTYAGGAADSISNKTIQNLLKTPLTFTKNEFPVWADGLNSQLAYGYHVQTYPGHRQTGAPPAEHVWKGDWRALNSSIGSSATSGTPFNESIAVTNIRGSAYDPGSTTLHVFKIQNVVGAFDRKRSPTYAWAGKYMFQDKSGPGSLITDADAWKYCVADNAGECRPGSAQFDSFVVVPKVFADLGRCYTNTMNLNAPCLIGANPLGGWAVQTEIDPVDTTGLRTRRLTLGLSSPGRQWTFSAWTQTPGGQWGFFAAPYVNGLRNEFFAFKLPPWPGQATGRNSGRSRWSFIPVSSQLMAMPGSQFARARFGYAENGPVSSFFCTSRQEACTTEIPVSSPNDPYAFAGENATHQDCGSGCTIKIPSVPGRVVYFVIERLDSSGNVIHTSQMHAVAIP